jgi:hypothetical protein
MTVSASPKGGAKFAHGDFDFLITTTETGYTTSQPRLHQPWNAYFFCSFYDEQGGVYFGGSPSGSYKNINGGRISYHPAPHDHSYSTGTGDGSTTPHPATAAASSGLRLLQLDEHPRPSRLRLRGQDVPPGRHRHQPRRQRQPGDVEHRQLGSAGRRRRRSHRREDPVLPFRGKVYCLDPSKGLMRSDDNGATFAVVNATFAGGGVDMDNDPASPDTLVISKASSIWLIANAKTTPGTTSQIGTSARFPNAGPSPSTATARSAPQGKSRLYALNNATSGGNPALYYSDDYGTTWTRRRRQQSRQRRAYRRGHGGDPTATSCSPRRRGR